MRDMSDVGLDVKALAALLSPHDDDEDEEGRKQNPNNTFQGKTSPPHISFTHIKTTKTLCDIIQ